jgi:regulator of cell morphogenesis and NO signaling
MSILDTQSTVGQLVKERPARARVFERLGIDYCCGGKTPLGLACRDKGLDPDQVLRELADLDAGPAEDEAVDWSTATLSELADHIVETHHAYLRRELPRLDALANTVAAAHGRPHPERLEVLRVFERLQAELELHMLKEEMILFPMVKKLESVTEPTHFSSGSVGNPISVMEHEHDDAGAALARLRELTRGYEAPADACNTYRALLDGLAELEADMHLHVHKENNLLFPGTLAREAAIRARAV